MTVKALTSFAGPNISMHKGEVREVSDKALLADLIKAGHVEEVKKKAVK